MKYVSICLSRPATITQVIAKVADIGILIPSTISLIITEDIIVVMLIEVDICHKRPAILTIKIGEQEFILKG